STHGTLCRLAQRMDRQHPAGRLRRKSPGLSGRLHPTHRPLLPAHPQRRARANHLPISRQRHRRLESFNPRHPRVPPPLPSACPAFRLSPHPLLRLAQSCRQKQMATHPWPARLETTPSPCAAAGVEKNLSLLRPAHAARRSPPARTSGMTATLSQKIQLVAPRFQKRPGRTGNLFLPTEKCWLSAAKIPDQTQPGANDNIAPPSQDQTIRSVLSVRTSVDRLA